MNGSAVVMYEDGSSPAVLPSVSSSSGGGQQQDSIQRWDEQRGENERGGRQYKQYTTSLPPAAEAAEAGRSDKRSRRNRDPGSNKKAELGEEHGHDEDFASIVINEDPMSNSSPPSPSLLSNRSFLAGAAVVCCSAGAVVLAACLISSAHVVDEGCVAVYFRNGALRDEVGEPGIRWARPFVTRVEQVVVRPETHYLDPLVCTTRDGVRNVFRDVQVITSVAKEQVVPLVREFGVHMKEILVYERVTEMIQLFCSNNTIDEVYNEHFLQIIPYVEEQLRLSLRRFAPADSVKVWNVFLPKPDVPPAIAANYRDVKVEWTKQLVAEQRQKTERIEKETEKMKAILDAEREKDVDLIEISKHIQQEEGKRNVSSINNAIHAEKVRVAADASSYAQEQEAASNQLLHTDSYVRLEVARALSNNTKLYFSGEDSVLGGVLGQVFGGPRIEGGG